MSEILNRIEINVYCTKNEPDYEVSFFDVKEVNDALDAARMAVRGEIKTIRIIQKSKLRAEFVFKSKFKHYKDLKVKQKILTDRYLGQLGAND